MRLPITAVLAICVCRIAAGQTYTISTVAGGAPLPNSIPGTSASLYNPASVAVDKSGNIFFADTVGHVVLRVDAITANLTVVAGNGMYGFSGDNGPATSARLYMPGGVAVDANGDLFIADEFNQRVRKVSNGLITTVAGNGLGGFGGDNGPATSARLSFPTGVAIDSAGNLLIADNNNNRIRKVTNNVITTVAGNGSAGFSGDGGPAASAQFGHPRDVVVDSAGNLYIADPDNVRIRMVSNGVITTVAGDGTPGFTGDDGPAIAARFNSPTSMAVDSAGNLYIVDSNNSRIRRVADGVITTVVGSGVADFVGDNGPAITARLNGPSRVAVDSSGNLYIADTGNSRIRKVSNGVITTVAGSASVGDNGPATSSQLYYPEAVALDSSGNLYIADYHHSRIRKVTNGVITTIAGTGTAGFAGDNGPAISARLNNPLGIAVDSAGVIYVGDTGNNRVRKIVNGTITTVAGTGAAGFGGDNGPATSARLYNPYGVTVDSAGSIYIADIFNHRVRKVTNGVITTVAGNGTAGFSGDNGPATNAQLNEPEAVALDSAGGMYIVEFSNNCVRKVTNGVITTLVGNGTAGFSGDNGPATSAQLSVPSGAALDPAGNLYIADAGNDRIRKVSGGVITTVAGNGVSGFAGDGGPATSAQLGTPRYVALDSAGNVYVAELLTNRVRLLTPSGPSCTYSLDTTSIHSTESGGSFTVAIQTTAACLWAVSGLPKWLTVSGRSLGSGPATVTLTMAPNTSGADLSATISIAGVPVAVTQAVGQTAYTCTNTTPPVITSVGSASAYGGYSYFAPGSWLEIKGTNLADPGDPRLMAAANPGQWTSNDFQGANAPTTLDGISVSINGKPAYVWFLSPNQLNVQAPQDSATGSVAITVTNCKATSAPLTLPLRTLAPGLLAPTNYAAGGTGYMVATFAADGAYVLNTATGAAFGLNSRPARPGELIVAYGIGFGDVTPSILPGVIVQQSNSLVSPVTVAFGSTNATLSYSGLAGSFVGLYEFYITVPPGLADGDYQINVTQNGTKVPQTMYLTVHN
jgi:uncharacterized protein (TIGR03437 family)